MRHRVPSGFKRSLQQETVSIHDMISSRKLQSLGKYDNENMSKAACLAIIAVYAKEEETVYRNTILDIFCRIFIKMKKSKRDWKST